MYELCMTLDVLTSDLCRRGAHDFIAADDAARKRPERHHEHRNKTLHINRNLA